MQNEIEQPENLLREVDELEQENANQNPELAQAIGYLKSKIETTQREREHLSKQSVHAQSLADVYALFAFNLKMFGLKNVIDVAQRTIQKLESPMYEGQEDILKCVMQQQRTERQVEMIKSLIDNVLDHWMLAPLRLFLPQVLKNDISKLIVSVSSMFGGEEEPYPYAEEINNHAP